MDGLDYHNQVVGYNVQRLRNQYNLTQKELADFIGVTTQTFAKMEKGLKRISLYEAKKIAEYFKVPAELFYSTDHRYEQEMVLINNIYEKYPDRWVEGIKRCAKLIEDTGQSIILHSQVLNLQGKLYLELGYHKQALDCFMSMYQEVKNINNDHLNFTSMHNLSIAYYYLKDFRMSLHYLDQVLNYSYDKSNWKAFNMKAILLIHEKRFDDAEGLLFEILPKFYKNGMISECARVLHNLGFLNERRERIEDAIFYFKQSLQTADEIKDFASLSLTSADLANIYLNNDNVVGAEELIVEALKYKIPLQLEIRLTLYWTKCTGHHNFKKQKLMGLVTKLEKCMDHELVATVYRELSRIYKLEKNYEQAWKYSELANQRLVQKIEVATKEI